VHPGRTQGHAHDLRRLLDREVVTEDQPKHIALPRRETGQQAFDAPDPLLRAEAVEWRRGCVGRDRHPEGERASPEPARHRPASLTGGEADDCEEPRPEGGLPGETRPSLEYLQVHRLQYILCLEAISPATVQAPREGACVMLLERLQHVIVFPRFGCQGRPL